MVGVALLNGLCAVTFLGHAGNGQVSSNTFHISHEGAGAPPDEPTLMALAAELQTAFAASYVGLGTTDWTWDQIVTKQVSDGTSADVLLEGAKVVNLPGAITNAGPYIPYGLCGCLSFKTAAASRRFRGHLLLPPCKVAAAVDGNILKTTGDYWMNMGALATAFALGTVGGAGWAGAHLADYKLAVFSRTAARLSVPSVANATAVIRKPTVSFLRRRERGTT